MSQFCGGKFKLSQSSSKHVSMFPCLVHCYSKHFHQESRPTSYSLAALADVPLCLTLCIHFYKCRVATFVQMYNQYQRYITQRFASQNQINHFKFSMQACGFTEVLRVTRVLCILGTCSKAPPLPSSSAHPKII